MCHSFKPAVITSTIFCLSVFTLEVDKFGLVWMQKYSQEGGQERGARVQIFGRQLLVW